MQRCIMNLGDTDEEAASGEAIDSTMEHVMEPERITAEEVKRRMDTGEAVVFLDSRAEDAGRKAETQIPKSIRVPPDEVEAHLDEIPRRGLIVPYCRSPGSRKALGRSARCAHADGGHTASSS